MVWGARRRFLQVAGASASVGLAGCSVLESGAGGQEAPVAVSEEPGGDATVSFGVDVQDVGATSVADFETLVVALEELVLRRSSADDVAIGLDGTVDLAALAALDGDPGLREVAVPAAAYDGYALSLSVSEVSRDDGEETAPWTGDRPLTHDFGVGDRDRTLRLGGDNYTQFWVIFNVTESYTSDGWQLLVGHSAHG